MTGLQRIKYRFFNIPPTPDTFGYRASVNTLSFRPFGDRQADSVFFKCPLGSLDTSNRAEYRILRAPAIIYALPKRAHGYANLFRPFTDGQGLSVDFNTNVIAFITTLFYSCSPPTIGRLVVALVVDAIQRMTQTWARPHICVELFKCLPSLTNCDTTTTIVGVKLIRRTQTSLTHLVERVPFRRACQSMGMIVGV